MRYSKNDRDVVGHPTAEHGSEGFGKRLASQEWPERIERLRERTQKYGLDSLHFDEQLELLLYIFMPHENVTRITEMAQCIAKHFRTMTRLVFAQNDAYEPLLLPNSVVQRIQLTMRMVRKYMRVNKARDRRIFRHRDLMMILEPLRETKDWPSTHVLYLDFEYHPMSIEKVADSTRWTTGQLSRHVIKRCVGLHARYIFLLLFCGTEPVDIDEQAKRYLVSFAQVLKAVKVLLLDLVVLSDQGIHSLSYDEKFDITHLEADWRMTHRPFMPNFNSPPGMVQPESHGDRNKR